MPDEAFKYTQKIHLIFCVRRDNANSTRFCFFSYFQTQRARHFHIKSCIALRIGNRKMATLVIELIIHRKRINGFDLLLSCQHFKASIFKCNQITCALTVAIAIFSLNALKQCLIKLNFIPLCETDFGWFRSTVLLNRCCCAHILPVRLYGAFVIASSLIRNRSRGKVHPTYASFFLQLLAQ